MTSRLVDSMPCKHPRTPDRRRRKGRRPERSPIAVVRAAVCLLLLTGLATACPKSPLGPPFEPAPRPPNNRGRVYVYRVDERGSLATVRITLDGREVGRFRNNEYETLELPAGGHHLRAGLRGFGLVAWGWNNHKFRLPPGETVYLKLSVRLTERSAPDAKPLEIGGRPSGAASENVFIIPRSAAEALSELETTTRLARSGAVANQNQDENLGAIRN